MNWILPEQHLRKFHDSFGKPGLFAAFFRCRHFSWEKPLRDFGANPEPTTGQTLFSALICMIESYLFDIFLKQPKSQSLVQFDLFCVPLWFECTMVCQNIMNHSKNVAGALGVIGSCILATSSANSALILKFFWYINKIETKYFSYVCPYQLRRCNYKFLHIISSVHIKAVHFEMVNDVQYIWLALHAKFWKHKKLFCHLVPVFFQIYWHCNLEDQPSSYEGSQHSEPTRTWKTYTKLGNHQLILSYIVR